MTFSSSRLPAGLILNNLTGIITGIVQASGETDVVLQATNSFGTTSRLFHIVIGEKLALTPPMGWSSLDFLQSEANETEIRAQADALITSGLINHGYSFINIDDGWSAKFPAFSASVSSRTSIGEISPNVRFAHLRN